MQIVVLGNQVVVFRPQREEFLTLQFVLFVQCVQRHFGELNLPQHIPICLRVTLGRFKKLPRFNKITELRIATCLTQPDRGSV